MVQYDGNGQVDRVTDASGKRRLQFAYTGGVMTSMKFQMLISAAWTDQHTTTFGYTSGHLTSVTIGGQLAQTNVYTSNYLTSIQDGGSKTLVNFVYDGATAGKIVRVDTPRGVVGYEFAPSRTECSGSNKTALYFHKANTTSCSTDTDCGSGFLCGGKTGAGATGQCFRGARCLTISSPSDDVITAVTAFAGNSESCEGACLEAIDHVWNTTSGALDLTAVKDPSNLYTTKEFNANGLPTRIVYGDANATPGGGLRELFLYYGNSSFPGKVTETRRKSDLASDASLCSATDTRGCARTINTYNSDGLLSSSQLTGTALDVSAVNLAFSYTTGYSYNSKGQLTQIDGPLSGSNDVTDFEYWSAPSDPLKDGFLQNLKRKKDTTTFLTRSSLSFDFWGNVTSLTDVDGTVSCRTFDTARNSLTQSREQMAGQSDCTTNAADLVTSYERDSALRLTRITRPDGSCVMNEYDTRGRLSKVKRRDDCNAASAGDTQEFTYSDDGLLIKTELKDSAGTVKKRQELTYFDSRRLERMINPVNTAKWTALTWEPRGLVESIAAVDGTSDLSRTEWSYDNEGRVGTETRYSSGGGADGWRLSFDWLGNQAQVTDGDSKDTTSKRDDLGRMVKLDGVDFPFGPTLRVFNAASQLTNIKEAQGSIYEAAHTFTFDNLGRPLVANYAGTCQTFNNPDLSRYYDAVPPGTTCPSGATCTNLGGRLAYVKVKLMCQTSLADKTLEQETWYGYDAAGRVTHEYIKDDNGRTAAHVYAWTKNGAMKEVTLPSTTLLGATFGSGGSNSDTDRISALWRTSTSTPIADGILYEPFGPVSQYNQQNSPGTGFLRTRIARNLAYRQTLNVVEKTDGTNVQSSVTVAEDNKGRTTHRDYFPSDPTIAGRYDSHYQYDQQDRVLCEATTSGMCPTSGTTLKNNHNATPPFTAGGDWRSLLHKIPGSTGVNNTVTLSGHFVYTVAQSSGTPTLGTTYFGSTGVYDRVADDNFSTLTHDRREYTYDARRNVVNVRGEYKVGANWNYYDVASAFDAKNRRVFKSFYNETTLKTATWFFYYDALDRLTEIKYTPDTSAASTYSLFQLVWLGDKLVLYWQTDYPSATTSKRYVSTDEMNRPVDMMSWPASGAAARVWTINPDAWGNDSVLVGSSVFQPLLFAGQYKDDETVAWQNDGVTRHRPGLALNGFRTYDPWVGAYLQVDPLVDSTWSSFVYVNSDPVGKTDKRGLQSCTTVDGYEFCWDDEIIEIQDTAPPPEGGSNGPTLGNWSSGNSNCPSGLCQVGQTAPVPPVPPVPPPPPPCSGSMTQMIACLEQQIWDAGIAMQETLCRNCMNKCQAIPLGRFQTIGGLMGGTLVFVIDPDRDSKVQDCNQKCYDASVSSPFPPDVIKGQGNPGCWY